MMILSEKINLINSKIQSIEELNSLLSRDISRIEAGMEDPDLSIEQCQELISYNVFKINKLKELLYSLD